MQNFFALIYTFAINVFQFVTITVSQNTIPLDWSAIEIILGYKQEWNRLS